MRKLKNLTYSLILFCSLFFLVLPVQTQATVTAGEDLCPQADNSFWVDYNGQAPEARWIRKQRLPDNTCHNPKFVICGNEGQKGCELWHVFLMIKYLFHQAVYVISPIIAVSLLAYAGLQMILAQGDSTKIRKARDIIKYTLIGLAFIWGAWFIVNQIGKIFGWGGASSWFKIEF